MLQIYNTLTREKEPFKPLREPDVKLYGCGPTVYNYAHLGNLRTYVSNDIIIRSLRFLGYRVSAQANITDIDDKTIRNSQKEGMSLKEFTEKYTKIFYEDLKRLNITGYDTFTPISELVEEMISMTQELLDKGYAYLADDGSVYFSVEKFKTYGELANLDMKGMKLGARVNHDEYEKDSLADFALWKGYDESCDGENKWEAEFTIDGEKKIVPGRPGWHIECSACNRKVHGDQIDIHLGGIDLVFPHHQNEIAQTEAVTGKEFCKYWVHSGHLLVDNKKMAKSAGNFYTLADILEKFDESEEAEICRAFRMMNLQNSYRDSFNFTFDRLEAGRNSIQGFDNLLRRMASYSPAQSDKIRRDFRDELQLFMQDFVAFIEDDFDTVQAMTVVFDFVGFVNAQIDSGLLSEQELGAVIDMLKSFDAVMGVIDFSLLEVTKTPAEVQELLDKRLAAKVEKKYDEADSYREQIESLGYRVVDEKGGSRVEKL